MNLLCLKSCSRFTRIRRGIAGAVIGDNPAAGKKFRGEQGSLGKSEGFKGAGRPVSLCQRRFHSRGQRFQPGGHIGSQMNPHSPAAARLQHGQIPGGLAHSAAKFVRKCESKTHIVFDCASKNGFRKYANFSNRCPYGKNFLIWLPRQGKTPRSSKSAGALIKEEGKLL
jgi:hypothetical protein